MSDIFSKSPTNVGFSGIHFVQAFKEQKQFGIQIFDFKHGTFTICVTRVGLKKNAMKVFFVDGQEFLRIYTILTLIRATKVFEMR